MKNIPQKPTRELEKHLIKWCSAHGLEYSHLRFKGCIMPEDYMKALTSYYKMSFFEAKSLVVHILIGIELGKD